MHPQERIAWSNRLSELRAARHEADYRERHACAEASLGDPYDMGALDPVVSLGKALSYAENRVEGDKVAAEQLLIGSTVDAAAMAQQKPPCADWEAHGPHRDGARFCTSCGGRAPVGSSS